MSEKRLLLIVIVLIGFVVSIGAICAQERADGIDITYEHIVFEHEGWSGHMFKLHFAHYGIYSIWLDDEIATDLFFALENISTAVNKIGLDGLPLRNDTEDSHELRIELLTDDGVWHQDSFALFVIDDEIWSHVVVVDTDSAIEEAIISFLCYLGILCYLTQREVE